MNNSYRQPSYASSQPLAPGPQSTYRPQSSGGPYGLPYQHGYSQSRAVEHQPRNLNPYGLPYQHGYSQVRDVRRQPRNLNPYGLPYQDDTKLARHGYSKNGPTYRGDSGVPQQSQIFNAVFGGMNQNPFYGDPFQQQQMIQQMRQSQAQQMMNSPQYQLRRSFIS